MITKDELDTMIEQLSPKGTDLGIDDLYVFDNFVVTANNIIVYDKSKKIINKIIGTYLDIYYKCKDEYDYYGINLKYFNNIDHEEIKLNDIDYNYLSIRVQDKFKQPRDEENEYGLFGVRERKTYMFDIPLFRYEENSKNSVDKFVRLVDRYCD